MNFTAISLIFKTAEFLYETNLFPEVEYSFKHALTTEVAYGALLHERRNFFTRELLKRLRRSSARNLRMIIWKNLRIMPFVANFGTRR